MQDPQNHIQRGKRGEDAAVAYLRSKGYKIIERNWTTRLGELDICAEKSGCLVLVEVKTRHSKYKRYLLDSITCQKKWRLVRLAECYRKYRKLRNCRVRLDIIGVLYDDKDNFLVAKHIKAVNV